jgi:hypothetical protein
MRPTVLIGLVLAAAVGYLAGTADGRRRAAQIRTKADSLAHDPDLRDKANKAVAAATSAGGTAISKAKDVAGTATTAAKSKLPSKNGHEKTIDVTDDLSADVAAGA